MSIERTTPPDLKLPEKIIIQNTESIKLDNGLTLYVINAGEKDVVKFEVIFPVGIENADQFTSAIACHQLTESGTSEYTANQLAEKFDFYGSFFQLDAGPDFKSFSLYALSTHFHETLPLFQTVIKDAVFPEKETELYKDRQVQTLAVNREKVSWLTRKTFNETVFSINNKYGFTSQEGDFKQLNSEKLRDFYRISYPMERAVLIASGKISEKIIKDINLIFGSEKYNVSEYAKTDIYPIPEREKIRIEKEGSLQSGIRIGRVLFNKSHPDFLPLQIVNTILGGYFGSRLMTNIREDKGFTYGIGSGIHSYLDSGVFFISTEVRSEVRQQAIDEIYKELTRLSVEPVPVEELNLVKSYLTGAFQRNLDGPFSLADQFKSIHLHNLKYDYFYNYLHFLKIIDPETIMNLTSQYLFPDHLTEVTVG